MGLLDITQLTHSFGDNFLFKNAEFSLNRGEHVGIVGRNGAGKSTLIKICTQQVIPDEGRIVWQPGTSAGYLDQYAQIKEELSMEAFLKTAFAGLYELERKMNALYEQAAEGNEDVLALAFQYQEQLELHDFYSIDTSVERVVTGLGLTALGADRAIGRMSGGQRAKVILAKLLLEKPDVLLLDEPTNFLDKEHVAWLAEYLAGQENAYMVISHDYGFLEKISNRICDIDNDKMLKYYGTYSEFLRKKALLREDYVRQYTAQQREIRKTEEFIRNNIAGRKSKMARGRRTRLERMEKLEAPETKEIRPVFRFSGPPLSNEVQLKVRRLAVGYEYPVLSGLDFHVKGGQKAVITGFNGIGKSTLLKTLVGQLPCMRGGFSFSEQVVFSYFEQELKWKDGERTPFEIVSDAFPKLNRKEIRQSLARCGVTDERAVQAIATLSGGEQAKVKMCLLTLKPCNFLILDEPTNHLDVQAKEALKEALIEFDGSVLLVSHEEAFYRGWVQQILDVGKRKP